MALSSRGRSRPVPHGNHGTKVALTGGLVGGLMDTSRGAGNELRRKGQAAGSAQPKLSRRGR